MENGSPPHPGPDVRNVKLPLCLCNRVALESFYCFDFAKFWDCSCFSPELRKKKEEEETLGLFRTREMKTKGWSVCRRWEKLRRVQIELSGCHIHTD